jgi:hypothetical protein
MKIKGKWRVTSGEWQDELWVAREDGADLSDTHWIAGEGRDETGTRSAEPCFTYTASVTICQVRNKVCGLNALQAVCQADSPTGERFRDSRENLLLVVVLPSNCRPTAAIAATLAR